MLVKLEIFPNFQGEKKKYLSCHQPATIQPFGKTLIFSLNFETEILLENVQRMSHMTQKGGAMAHKDRGKKVFQAPLCFMGKM